MSPKGAERPTCISQAGRFFLPTPPARLQGLGFPLTPSLPQGLGLGELAAPLRSARHERVSKDAVWLVIVVAQPMPRAQGWGGVRLGSLKPLVWCGVGWGYSTRHTVSRTVPSGHFTTATGWSDRCGF
jgi:hypothetical protein